MINNIVDIGDIHSPEHYKFAKMLNHSAWLRGDFILPRGITPSDIDMVLDNNGKILFCELSSSANSWVDISLGQRWVYESAIKHGPHVAVLCVHNIIPNEDHKICTRNDIIKFQPMVFYEEQFLICEMAESNERWQRFVRNWYERTDALRAAIIKSGLEFKKKQEEKILHDDDFI